MSEEIRRCQAYRQGELLFIPVTLTKEQRQLLISKGRDLRGNIREGEVSGHIHACQSSGGLVIELPDSRGQFWADGESFRIPAGEMFMTSENQIKITHPEHRTLPLDRGDYVIRVQKEYDEVRDRLVAD